MTPDPGRWACPHDPPLPWCLKCYLAGRVAAWPPASGHGSPVTAAGPQPIPPAPCRHLATGEPFTLRECPTCAGGRVKLKEWRCELGRGVAGRAVPSLDCGARCPGYCPAAENGG